MTVKHFVQFANPRLFACCLVFALASGCGTQATTVATEVRVVEKPVPVPCKFEWPARPAQYVANVQLTGNPLVDLVMIWRAAEAELEARIAYEMLFEAAAKACTG